MYYEKCIKCKTYDNKKLIKLSQLRRTFLSKMNLSVALEYYENFIELINQNFKIIEHPLFVWKKQSSTCFLFEKIHVQDFIANAYQNNAVDKEPKEAKKNFHKALEYNIKCVNDLERYVWEDTDILGMPIMMQYFHLSKALNNASNIYLSMHNFKQNLPSVRRAYHYKKFASCLWKTHDLDPSVLESLTLLEMAKELDDEKCGEKIALIHKYKNTNECSEFYKTWKQQNEAVYFNPEHTDLKIKSFTLREAFQDLSKLLSSFQSSEKD